VFSEQVGVVLEVSGNPMGESRAGMLAARFVRILTAPESLDDRVSVAERRRPQSCMK
jgi:hypothetical protein